MTDNPSNLDQKIGLLLEDIEKLSKGDASKKIKALILEELEWRRLEHQVDQYDLTDIRSAATKFITDYSTNEVKKNGFVYDQHKLIALSWVEATISHFRRRGLIPFTIVFSRKDRP